MSGTCRYLISILAASGSFAVIHSGYRDKKLTGETGQGRYTDIYEKPYVGAVI